MHNRMRMQRENRDLDRVHKRTPPTYTIDQPSHKPFLEFGMGWSGEDLMRA